MIRNITSLLLVVMLLAAVILAAPGCDSSQEDAKTTSTSDESLPIEIGLELSRAPKLGETAELIYTIYPHDLPVSGTVQCHVWIEVRYTNTTGSYQESKLKIETPVSDILTGGKSSWDLSLTEEGKPVELRSTISFTEEGIWEIEPFYQEVGWGKPMRGSEIKVVVYHDRAGIYRSEAYNAGELEWMKDYSPSLASGLDNPIQGTMDLSNPPRLGEPVELTWSVTTTYDVENLSVKTKLYYCKPGSWERIEYNGETMLVEGDVTWQGALKAGVPLSSSATIILPTEGDWQISVSFSDADKVNGYTGMQDNVRLNVTEDRGRWGWVESHERDRSGDPQPPSAPLPSK